MKILDVSVSLAFIQQNDEWIGQIWGLLQLSLLMPLPLDFVRYFM